MLIFNFLHTAYLNPETGLILIVRLCVDKNESKDLIILYSLNDKAS